MQPIRHLERLLADLATPERYLFSATDLQALCPPSSNLSVLLSRAAKAGILHRVCRGIYLFPRVAYPRGRVLFHAAALLRANAFNYISLETALSDAGIISQVPFNRITLMSSGRTHTISCGSYGTMEFVHTARRPDDLAGQLTYDAACRLWRASPSLALRDMRATRRNLDLINPEVIHELV
jgi:predicted transcriptional regulator of viral defense system